MSETDHNFVRDRHFDFINFESIFLPFVRAEVPSCSPAELEDAKMFPRTHRIGNKKIATNMCKLEFVIHFYSNINCIHMSL